MQIALASLGLGATSTSTTVEAALKLRGRCDGMRLFGRCVPKLYVYGGAGAVALIGLLVLRRRRAA